MSAYARRGVVSAKLAAEVKLGRVAGPFSEPPLEDWRVSPLGLVLKKERISDDSPPFLSGGVIGERRYRSGDLFG